MTQSGTVRHRRKVRYVIAVIGLLAIIGGLAGIKVTQIKALMNAGEAMAKAGPPPEAVSSAKAQEMSWEEQISAVGTINPGKGVTVANDAPGVVTAIKFESGAQVKKGQVLVELDSDVERAQLSSAVARRSLAKVSVDRSKSLVGQNAAPKSELDNVEAELKAASADVAALQAQIDRKVIRAPFDGRLGIRQVNLGQYLGPGTAITILQATEALFVDFTVPQEAMSKMVVGSKVRINQGAPGPKAEATIDALDPTLDPVTRSIKVRALLPEKLDTLRPGMFVTVSVVLADQKKFIVIPATALVHASYGDSVFIVEDGKARQQFVKKGEARGDMVAILDGVKAGEEVVVAGAFKLRNGAAIMVNNAVKLDPKVAPRPENQ